MGPVVVSLLPLALVAHEVDSEMPLDIVPPLPTSAGVQLGVAPRARAGGWPLAWSWHCRTSLSRHEVGRSQGLARLHIVRFFYNHDCILGRIMSQVLRRLRWERAAVGRPAVLFCDGDHESLGRLLLGVRQALLPVSPPSCRERLP